MGIEYGWFRMNGYEDINDNVNSQNGAWMTSWLSDHTEKLNVSIPDKDKDTVKIWNMIVDSVLEISRSKNYTEIKRNKDSYRYEINRWYATMWHIT